MNLLAHAVLSPNNDQIRVGNVLADFIHRNEKASLLPEMQVGWDLHQRIDKFTDNHRSVQRSYDKLVGFQRFANPLIDVFYDHFLVMNWELEWRTDEYVGQLYRTIESLFPDLPENCVAIATKMIEQDWLNNYGTYTGLETNLRRMEGRIEYVTGRKVDLVSSLQILETKYVDFERDFLEFWPSLQTEAAQGF